MGWLGLLDPTSCQRWTGGTQSILRDCNAVNGGYELEMKIFIFTPPHSTKDLMQLETNVNNVKFIYK